MKILSALKNKFKRVYHWIFTGAFAAYASAVAAAFCFIPAFASGYGGFADSSPDPGSAVFYLIEEDSDVSFNEDGRSAGGVLLSLSYGYKNIAKTGHKLPVTVTVLNGTDGDVSGRLTVESEGSIKCGPESFDRSTNRYIFSVHAAPGDECQVDFLISAPEDESVIKLSLYNEAGDLISEKTEKISVSSGSSELLAGLLSDTPEKLDYFKYQTITGSPLRLRTVELDPADLPESPGGLEQLDLIIISNLNPEKLSSSDADVLGKWVENGGALVIGSGGRPEAAAMFGEDIEDFDIGEPRETYVDMGMQYSQTGPDGAVLKITACDIKAGGGYQALQSSDMAVLTMCARHNGVIAFTAYDLCDISDFCVSAPNYAGDFLKIIFSAGGIRGGIVQNSSGSGYTAAKDMLGIPDKSDIPRISVYAALAALYLIFISVILYLWLKNRDLGIYYPVFAGISAFVAALVVWFAGTGYRKDEISIEYTGFEEIYEGDRKESGFMSLSSAGADTAVLRFKDGLEVYPVIYKTEKPESIYDSRLDIDMTEGERSLTVNNAGAFTENILEYSTEAAAAPEPAPGVDADVLLYGEALSGSIENNTGCDLEDTAVLFFGRLVRLGDIAAGERIDLTDYEPLVIPLSDMRETAVYITGLKNIPADSDEYTDALRKTNMLEYYIENHMGLRYKGAWFLAFGEGGSLEDSIEKDRHLSVKGLELSAYYIDSISSRGSREWRNALSTEPEVISGDYDSASNTTRGAAVIEYGFGNDLSISELYFAELPEEFETDELTPFSGQISLYNYNLGVYEYIRDKREFDYAQTRPYISPSNTLTVRYVPDGSSSSDRGLFLPEPAVIGIRR